MRPAGSLPATIIGNTTNETVLQSPQPPSQALALGIPGNSSTDSKILRGTISGFATLKAAGNVIVALYAGRSLIVAQNTQLAAITFAMPVGTAPWGIIIPAAIYNQTQGKLMGSVSQLDASAGVPGAAAGFLAPVPLVGDPKGGALAYLSLTVKFAAADPTNLLTLTDFVLDS